MTKAPRILTMPTAPPRLIDVLTGRAIVAIAWLCSFRHRPAAERLAYH